MNRECPECGNPLKDSDYNNPYYYCGNCKVSYHINLFISKEAYRKRLGLDNKKTTTLEKWLE